MEHGTHVKRRSRLARPLAGEAVTPDDYPSYHLVPLGEALRSNTVFRPAKQ